VPALVTPRQGQYLAFIYYYTKVNRQPPSEADIQRYFSVSAPSVHQMIISLEKAGYIERKPGQRRSVRVVVSKSDLPELE
jgi:Mn-dependent DtxR family transcriptional regulator